MAAVSVTLTNVTSRSVGDRIQATALLSMVISSTNYVTGGFPMPTGWRNTMRCPDTMDFHSLSGPLMLATPAEGQLGHVDLTTNTLVLFGGATTAAEDVPLEELPPSSSAIADGTYTCYIMTQGV